MGEAPGQTLHEYCVFGLPILSTIVLPELDTSSHGAPGAIRIGTGDLSGPARHAEPHRPVDTSVGVILTIPGVAHFCVREGREIVVDADPAASGRNVRLFLLGSVMGVLLHQRGILPLHANAIDIDGEAVAFLGHSGAGKSTLAAAFHDRGSAILSDDVCALERHGDRFIAQPGIPRLRLWRDAVERSGRKTESHERAFDALDKYTVATDRAARADAMPLKAIYLLIREDAGAAPEIRALSGKAAFQALTENTYRGAFINIVGDPAAHFATCLALSRGVPVFTLARPWDPHAILDTTMRVEAHLRSLPA